MGVTPAAARATALPSHADPSRVPNSGNSSVNWFTKRSLLRKPGCRSDQADIGAETRRRSLFIASQAIFRYYFLIRSNQDHSIRTGGVYASAAGCSGTRAGRGSRPGGGGLAGLVRGGGGAAGSGRGRTGGRRAVGCRYRRAHRGVPGGHRGGGGPGRAGGAAGPAGRDADRGQAARSGAARVGGAAAGGVREPRGRVRRRDGAGYDAGVRGAGRVRGRGGRGRRPVRGRV